MSRRIEMKDIRETNRNRGVNGTETEIEQENRDEGYQRDKQE